MEIVKATLNNLRKISLLKRKVVIETKPKNYNQKIIEHLIKKNDKIYMIRKRPDSQDICKDKIILKDL